MKNVAMNAERLLAHYEKIADAPDAIARLRRFVLDLAVRGKLVPQEADDEPASELLKRIARERLGQDDLPPGWWRTRIGSILDFQYGKGLKASERLEDGPVPVFGSNGIVGFTDEPLTARPSIIVGRKGSAGALNLCDGPSWTTDVAYFVEAPSFLDLRFLLNALAALDLDKLGKGVKPGLSRSEAYDQIIAIPPLAEQQRIVAKVDELMDLCDRLEAARAGRETARDGLAAASLARLNTPDPETFQADARFALDALPALTTRPDQIRLLRQTILNLAACEASARPIDGDAGEVGKVEPLGDQRGFDECCDRAHDIETDDKLAFKGVQFRASCVNVLLGVGKRVIDDNLGIVVDDAEPMDVLGHVDSCKIPHGSSLRVAAARKTRLADIALHSHLGHRAISGRTGTELRPAQRPKSSRTAGMTAITAVPACHEIGQSRDPQQLGKAE